MPSAFEQLLAVAKDRKLPPVDRWQPATTASIDIHGDHVWSTGTRFRLG